MLVTDDNTNVRYVIKVKNQKVSVPFASVFEAQNEIRNLPVDQQVIAEVVPIKDDGTEIILG